MSEIKRKQYYGMTLDPDVAEKIKEVAIEEKRSFSFCVNEILSQTVDQWLEEEANQQPRPTRRK